MTNNKILTLLGFAAKAGKLSYGMDSAKEAVLKSKSKLVVAAEDISPKSQKEIAFYSDKIGVKVLVVDTLNIENISHAIGKRCGIVSVNDESFANGIMNASIMGGNANE